MEECSETLAFASEPVLASLANVLSYQEQKANAIAQQASAASSTTATNAHVNPQSSHQGHNNRIVYSKEYEMLDMEIKYGLLQVRALI